MAVLRASKGDRPNSLELWVKKSVPTLLYYVHVLGGQADGDRFSYLCWVPLRELATDKDKVIDCRDAKNIKR